MTSAANNLEALTIDELAGVVSLFPWFAQARVALASRMAAMGADSWGKGQFAASALHVGDRSKIFRIMKDSSKIDCSDKDIAGLVEKFISTPSRGRGQVRVAGGDFFSQDQYDSVREDGDGFFSRMSFKAPASQAEEGTSSEIEDFFCTETLAAIYAEQGRYAEARSIYSRLLLKFPEKSAYFAALIEKID